MSMSTDQAAATLQSLIKVPRGTVNTVAYRDAQGPIIRVMIDPLYLRSVTGVPEMFEGYRVVVEKREPSIAHLTIAPNHAPP